MEPRSLAGVLLGILLFNHSAFALYESCAQQSCPNGSGLFTFTNGNRYGYSYRTQITSDVSQSSSSSAVNTYSLDLTMEISVGGPCDYQLTTVLNSVKDQGTVVPTSLLAEFQAALESNVVKFGYYDGRVGEVCAPADETPLALNIKKGFISLLQVSSRDGSGKLPAPGNFVEVDLAGECPSVYTVHQDSTEILRVNRTRDIAKCDQSSPSHLTSTFSPFDKAFQSLIKSRPSCEILIQRGIIQSGACVEDHVFAPFYGHRSPFTVQLTQEFKLQYTIPAEPVKSAPSGLVSSDLRYVFGETSGSVVAQPVTTLFTTMCDSVVNDVRPETPAAFSSLVRRLRQVTDCSELASLYEAVRSGTICPRLSQTQRERILYDAVPVTGTACSVALISKILLEKDLQTAETELWFASLSFIKHPEKRMLDELKPLWSHANLPRSGYLGISSLAHNYGRFNPHADHQPLVEMEMELLKKIDTTCHNSIPENQDDVVTYLAAVGNLGVSQLIADMLHTLAQCTSHPMAVRVAAVQAFRKRSCEATLQTDLFPFFANNTEDVELRLAAYQRLMDCADSEVIGAVIKVYEENGTHPQVKSYVYSHLRSIAESVDESLQPVRLILSAFPKVRPPSTSELYRISRHVQRATKNHPFNGTLYGDVIFADHSFLPRTGDIGLDINLFGETVNMFEIGGRMQGFDDMIGNFVGPAGFASSSAIETLVGYFTGGAMRGEGDATKDLPGPLQQKHDSFNYKSTPPEFSAYFTLFDNDISMFTSMDLQSAIQNVGIFDLLLGFSKEHSFETSRNVMLLDGTYSVPTSSGLPIALKLTATAAGKVKGNGLFNLHMNSATPAATIQGQISPSAAVKVSATFTINTYGTPIGFKTVTTLHTSTSLSGSVDYAHGQHLRANLDVPQEKVEFVTFESKSFGVHGKEERPIIDTAVGTLRSNLTECTAPLTSRVLGVEFCMELESRDPADASTPRNGLLPAKFRTYLQKTDKTMQGYKFVFEYPQPKGGETSAKGFNILFDTPGSKVDRKLQLGYSYHPLNGIFTGSAVSPWKKIVLDGQYVSSPVKFDLTVKRDDLRQYKVNFVMPDKLVDGQRNFQPDLKMEFPLVGLVEVNGNINKNLTGFDSQVDLSLRSRVVTGRVVGNLEKQDKGHTAKATVTYRTGKATKNQEIIINHKTRPYPMVKDLWKILAMTTLELTEYPALSTQIQTELLRSPFGWSFLEASTTVSPLADPENQKITLKAEIGLVRGEYNNVTVGALVKAPHINFRGTPLDGSARLSAAWSRSWNFFEGHWSKNVSGYSFESHAKWDEKFSTEKRIVLEAGFNSSKADDSRTRYGHLRAAVRDNSAFLSRLYPFGITADAHFMKPVTVEGDLSFTRTDAGLKVVTTMDSTPIYSSTTTVAWNPISFDHQCSLLNKSSRVTATYAHPFDWSVTANHTGSYALEVGFHSDPVGTKASWFEHFERLNRRCRAKAIVTLPLPPRTTEPAMKGEAELVNRYLIQTSKKYGFDLDHSVQLVRGTRVPVPTGSSSSATVYLGVGSWNLRRDVTTSGDLVSFAGTIAAHDEISLFYGRDSPFGFEVFSLTSSDRVDLSTLSRGVFPTSYKNITLKQNQYGWIPPYTKIMVSIANLAPRFVFTLKMADDEDRKNLQIDSEVEIQFEFTRGGFLLDARGAVNGSLISIPGAAPHRLDKVDFLMRTELDFSGTVAASVSANWDSTAPTSRAVLSLMGSYKAPDTTGWRANLTLQTPFVIIRSGEVLMYGNITYLNLDVKYNRADLVHAKRVTSFSREVSAVHGPSSVHDDSNVDKFDEIKHQWVVRVPSARTGEISLEYLDYWVAGVDCPRTGKRRINLVDVFGTPYPVSLAMSRCPNTTVEFKFMERALRTELSWSGIEVLWDAKRDPSKKLRLTYDALRKSPQLHRQQFAFEHPLFGARIVDLNVTDPWSRPLFAARNYTVAINDRPSFRIVGPNITRDRIQLDLFSPPTSNQSYKMLANFVDSDSFYMAVDQPVGPDESGTRFLYNAWLENHDELLQRIMWDNEFRNNIKSVILQTYGDTMRSIGEFLNYSERELIGVGRSFTETEAFRPLVSALSTAVSSGLRTVGRYARNYGFPPSQCGPGAQQSDSGSSSSGSAQACSGSSSFASSFAAFSNQVNTQLQTMMQDMMSKLQQQQASSPNRQSYSGSVNVISGGCGAPTQSPCAPSSGGMFALPSIQIQVPSPQQPRQPSSSNSGSGSGSYQHQQASYQGYAAQGSSQASYGSGSAPSGACAPSSPSAGSSACQSPPSYGPAPSPQYSSPSYGPAPSPQYSSPSYGSAQSPQYSSPDYSASPSQQYPSYSPSGQPPQGAQIHASQKTQQRYQSQAQGQASYSHTVPVGNTRLTIQIFQQPGESPAPAPAPGPSSSGSGQYDASASQNQQHALSGQAQYGGGAEPRLQYCTPGSTEKGVCLHQGDESQEPTRSKREAGSMAEAYMDMAKDKVRQAWYTFVNQPEVQYLISVSRRVEAHLRRRYDHTQGKSTLPVVDDYMPKVLSEVQSTPTQNATIKHIKQRLPVKLLSLRRPIPLVLVDAMDRLKYLAPDQRETSLLRYPPSFEGVSYIAVSGETEVTIRSFDGEIYTMDPPACTYVVAHDFDASKFTISARLEMTNQPTSMLRLAALEVRTRTGGTPTTQSVEVFGLGDIDHFDTIAHESFNATFSPGRLTIASRDGWNLVYNQSSEVLKMTVSGFYAGRTAGLFGSFNRNPEDDFATPDHTVMGLTDLGKFVQSWATPGNCSILDNLSAVTLGAIRRTCADRIDHPSTEFEALSTAIDLCVELAARSKSQRMLDFASPYIV